MKVNSKFIALGIGITIFFTGSCLGYSYFSDSDTKSNVLRIGKLVEEKPTQPTIETEAEIDHEELELNLKKTGINVADIESVEFISGSGEFNKTSHSVTLDRDDKEVEIKFDKHIKTKHIDTKMPSKDTVTIKIHYKDRVDTYEISLIQKLKGDDDDLYAFWQMIDSKPIVIEGDLEIKPEDTTKPETDAPNTEKPEDSTEPKPEIKPEETPSKPGETTPKPEEVPEKPTQKPEVEVPVEPKPDVKPDVKPEVTPEVGKVESTEQIDL
jgi:hypothetical protein